MILGFWDGQGLPSIECPIGDFFGFSHGHPTSYQSVAHSVSSTGGRNIWLPMPFTRSAKLEFTNEGEKPATVYYQIDYTLGDRFADDVGRLHVLESKKAVSLEPSSELEICTLRSGGEKEK